MHAPIHLQVSRRSPKRSALLLSTLICLAALLTGCSGGTSGGEKSSAVPTIDLASISVTGNVKSKPTVSFTAPLSTAATERKVLVNGTGAKAQAGQRVTVQYVGINGTDGKEFDSTYGRKPLTFVLDSSQNMAGLVNGLVDTPIGSRVLLLVPPTEGFGLEGRPAAGIGPTDSLVLVVDLTSARTAINRATGDKVAVRAGLPTVTLDKVGRPKIAVPGSAAPKSMVVQPLIAGKGAKVARGQQVTIRYTGVLWPGGKQFDTNWTDKTPAFTFEIGTGAVISGMDRGLIGQTVGSQVMLVVPPDDGYGAEGSSKFGIAGTDTLVLVVDILDVT